MTAFQSFPYDVIFETCKFLNLDDVVHLSQKCHELRASVFSNDQVARKVVAVRMRRTPASIRLTVFAGTPLLHGRSFGGSLQDLEL